MKVKEGLNWQKRAKIVFTVTIILLSIILTVFAIREAERERLVLEKEIGDEQERLTDLIINIFKSIIFEAEGRITNLVQDFKREQNEGEFTRILQRIKRDEEIVLEFFLVNHEGRVTFPLFKPLYSIGINRRKERNKISGEGNYLLKQAETYEFISKNYILAIKTYQKILKKTSEKNIRARLLNCIGRCYKKSRQFSKAVNAYQKISDGYTNVLSTDNIPLAIIAQFQIGDILWTIKREIDGFDVFLNIYKGLLESEWPLNKNQFFFYLNKVKDIIISSGLEKVSKNEKENRLKERQEKLNQLLNKKIKRMNSAINVKSEIVPLFKIKNDFSVNTSENFLHIVLKIDKELYFVAYSPVLENSTLGIRIDHEFLRNKLLPSKLKDFILKKDWNFQIVDENGKRVAGEEIANLKNPENQVTFSKGFGENFLPWKVNIFHRDLDRAKKRFKSKRNIYIFTVLAVMSAIFFGGYFGIKSMAKELKLAKLKSDFVATVSHELRTPLTSIRYMVELLQRGRINGEKKKQLYYDTLTRESGRLSRLIENILDFSKIEAGMKEYLFKETNLAVLTEEVAFQFQQQVASKEFIFKYEIADQMPKGMVDREEISRVLFNLLDNSLKYSGKNPKISLSAWADTEYIFWEVTDKGMGIRGEEQKRVFEKFYRAENVQDTSIKGSGIGLTQVDHIIKAHKGRILLKSEKGKGTKVTIRIPIGEKLK